MSNDLSKLVNTTSNEIPPVLQKIVKQLEVKNKEQQDKDLQARNIRQTTLHNRPPAHGAFCIGGQRHTGRINYET